MLQYIHQLLKNRKANQLLARIAQHEPEWAANSTDGTDQKILDYIMLRLREYAHQKAAYEQQRSGRADGRPTVEAVEAPVFSPILTECLAWWADDPPSVYARLWLLKEIELAQLHQRVAAIETMVNGHQAMVDDYRHCYQTMIQLTREAERMVQLATTLSESIRPEKRMN